MTAQHLNPAVRHDIQFIFDVLDGNPNGDPDGDNAPRSDMETGNGIVTDGALKRKIRDTVPLLAQANPDLPQIRYGIFVRAGEALNTVLEESYQIHGLALDKAADDDSAGGGGGGKKKKVITPADATVAKKWLQERYFDLRFFGGVLSTGKTQALGQLRGPMQVSFARSIDPIQPQQHGITRVTATRQEDIDAGKIREMGSKWTVPYGAYVSSMLYSGPLGIKAGVTPEDLDLFYRALLMMWDLTASASRGTMATRGIYVFSHSNGVGDAPASKLRDLVRISRATDTAHPARSIADYTVEVDESMLPDGVTLAKLH